MTGEVPPKTVMAGNPARVVRRVAPDETLAVVDSTANKVQSVISPKAQIGRSVSIGHACRVHGNVIVGNRTEIGDCSVIGIPAGGKWANQPVRIGANSVIRSHAAIYEGSEFGPKLETGHHVLIREGTVAGENLRVGSHSDLEGDCVIGDFCRFHSYTHIGRGSKIGHFVWLYSLTTLTNDALPPSELFEPVTIEDGVVVCVGCTVLPGATLAMGSFVAAGSVARGRVPAGGVVAGWEGRIIGHVSDLANAKSGIHHPWMPHFGKHYPSEARPRLESLAADILNGRREFMAKHFRKRK